MGTNVSISLGDLASLVEAKVKNEMLERLLLDRKYIGMSGEDIALLCKLFGIEREKE